MDIKNDKLGKEFFFSLGLYRKKKVLKIEKKEEKPGFLVIKPFHHF